jgi:hypothetical protein
VTEDNLLFVQDRLLRSDADRAALLTLYGRIRAGRRVAENTAGAFGEALRLSGVARVDDGGHLRVRNRIYARAFDKKWVGENFPGVELRRQRAAFRRGLALAMAASMVLIAAFSYLALAARHQARRAAREAAKVKEGASRLERLLYSANMNLLQTASDAGNIRRASQLLEETRGDGNGGLEWAYWNQLLHLNVGSARTRSGRFDVAGRFAVRLLEYGGDGSHSYRITVWELATGKVVNTFNVKSDLTELGREWLTGFVRVSADGGIVALPSGPSYPETPNFPHKPVYLDIWDVRKGTLLRSVRVGAGGGSEDVTSFSFELSPKGRYLAVGQSHARLGIGQVGQERLSVWDLTSGSLKKVIAGHGAAGESFGFTPDERWLVTVGTVPVRLDTRTWRPSPVAGWRQIPPGGSASRDNRRPFVTGGGRYVAQIVTASPDQTDLTLIWNDVLTGSSRRSPLAGQPACLDISPDGKRIAAGYEDGSVRVSVLPRSTGSTGENLSLMAHPEPVVNVRFASGGKFLVTQDRGQHEAKIWDAMHSYAKADLPPPDAGEGPAAGWARTQCEASGDGSRVARLALRYLPSDEPDGKVVGARIEIWGTRSPAPHLLRAWHLDGAPLAGVMDCRLGGMSADGRRLLVTYVTPPPMAIRLPACWTYSTPIRVRQSSAFAPATPVLTAEWPRQICRRT